MFTHGILSSMHRSRFADILKALTRLSTNIVTNIKIMSFLYVEIQVASTNLEPERHVLASHFQKIFEYQNCKFGIF